MLAESREDKEDESEEVLEEEEATSIEFEETLGLVGLPAVPDPFLSSFPPPPPLLPPGWSVLFTFVEGKGGESFVLLLRFCLL